MIVELTDDKHCVPISVKIAEIQALKEDVEWVKGRPYPHTLVFYGEKENEHCIKVTESAKEIGRKIIEVLKDAGNDIKVTSYNMEQDSQ